MTSTQEFTKFFGQFPTDTGAATDAWKTWASFNERLSGIALGVAAKSNEIATTSARETFSRLSEITKVREEPAEYGQAVNDFAQAQAELSRRTAEAFAGVLSQAQSETAELMSNIGEEATQKGADTTKSAAGKTADKTKQAAKAAK